MIVEIFGKNSEFYAKHHHVVKVTTDDENIRVWFENGLHACYYAVKVNVQIRKED